MATSLQKVIKNVTRAVDVPSFPGLVCYTPVLVSAQGVWEGGSPLDYGLPLFILQIVLVVLTTRALVFLLKPFRQPRVISEIIGGIILGPSVLGQVDHFADKLFPVKSLLTLETVAHLGLLYFLFIVGVEMDILVIKRMGRKALIIAIAGMALPFCIGTSTSFLLRNQISKNVHQIPFLLFLGVALSVTAFPVLARILAEIKLLNTELGRISMSSAIVNDMCAWVLLALCITLADKNETALSSLWVLLSGIGFILFCFYAVRPAMWWLIRRIPEGDGVSDGYICLILTGVMLSGAATDAIGIHSVFGAFVYGLVIPSGPLGEALVDKMEDFVNGLLLPLFFVISGLNTDVSKVRDPVTVGLLMLVFALASLGKIVGTVLISMFYNMPFRDGVSLGFLMSTRGLVEVVILNIGRDKQVLDDESFTVLVLMSVVMTAMVTPVVTTVHRPARLLLGYKRRNLQRSKPDMELRMLACLYTPRHVPTMISLLEISNPTKRSPIFLYALQLIELTGRASAMLAVHSSGSSKSRGGAGMGHSDNIFVAFEQLELRAGGVSVQPLSAVSPYSTMHEDVCRIAADKHVSFIILPFHKHQTVDGGMEADNPGMRIVNNHVLTHAPCSVGLLVDRGLGASGTGVHRAAAAAYHFAHHVAVLFFGGPDDREALAYAWRMAEHPGIGLAIVRFLPTSASPTPPPSAAADPRVVTVTTSEDREREMDDEYLSEFRLKNLSNETVIYMEKAVSNSEDTVAVIRLMDSIYDMYIVGRGQGQGAAGQLTAGLMEWSECPELGPIGDLLVSSDFAATVSVLVVQQYVGGGNGMGESPTVRRRQQQQQQQPQPGMGTLGREQRGEQMPTVGANAFNIGRSGRDS